jgi:phospholipid transport system substrate-binding protein
LVKSKGEWRVYDVVIEEVSLVSTYRKTYGKIVDREGFDGLFARMEKKIEELQNTPAPKKTQT